jgi:DNA-binding GntR family transcriptional regulator
MQTALPTARAAPSISPGRDRLYSMLIEEILRGDLTPGARLIEEQLTRRFAVSRTPVREALFRLERDGLVHTELHRGFRVAPLTETEARQIYPIIGTLEGLALRESGSLLESVLPALTTANRKLSSSIKNPRAALAADQEFHAGLVSLCPNMHLLELLEILHRRAFRYEQLFMRESALIHRSVAQHDSIIQAIASGIIGDAEHAVRMNYQTGMESLVAKLRGATREIAQSDEPRRKTDRN